MSLAEEILAFDDRQGEDVEAWGKRLKMRPISGTDRDAFDFARHRASQAGTPEKNWRALYVAYCLYDREGNRVFTADQAEALGDKNGETIKRLFEVAERVSDMEPGSVETSAKNS
jgi:hypothetical protein